MRLREGLKLRKVGSRYMIVDSQGGTTDFTTIYTLNEMAACIWQKAAEGEFTEARLRDWLCEEYEVDTLMAEEDIKALLNQWKEYGLTDE